MWPAWMKTVPFGRIAEDHLGEDQSRLGMSERLTQALEFATQAHGDQTYGADLSYSTHLVDVVVILNEFGYTEAAGEVEMLVAAYLHDVVEDTEVTEEQVAERFGVNVARMVRFCTDEPGHNRKTRKTNTYARCRADLNKEPWVYLRGSIVKLADRLANIRNCHAHRPDLLHMYWKEKDTFRQALKVSGVAEPMWAEYDRLLANKPPKTPRHK